MTQGTEETINETLVEYQEKVYNEIVGEYFFECTGGGVTKAVQSPKKQALKKGVKLHLFRYGFFEKESDLDVASDIDRVLKGKTEYTVDEVSVKNDNIPTNINNFYLARTFLRPGYVYIIDKKDNGRYREYQVNESGKLESIIWSKGNAGDIRRATGSAKAFITINDPGEYYITYSPIQWSRNFFNKVNGSDEEKQKLMQTINCVGIEIGKAPDSDEVVSYNEVKVVSFKNHPQKHEFRSDLHEIDADEKKQTQKGDNDFYEDMFVALHDPIGCVNDVANILITEHQKHEALIESIQTGQSESEILERLEKDQSRSSSFTDYEQQVAGLFSTALTTYQLIYNDEKMQEEYADTTDKNKLLKILAVEERKERREQINSVRNDFGNLLSSNYFLDYLSIFTDGGNDAVFEGNYTVASFLELLAMHPHDKDRHLDLRKDYTGRQDQWKNFYTNTLKDDNPISLLLSKEVKLEELQEAFSGLAIGFSLSKKLISTLKSISDSYAKYAIRETDFEIVLKYAKSFKYRGEPVIQVRRKQVEDAIKKGFVLNTAKWVEEQQVVNYKRGHKLIRIKTRALNATPEEIIANKRINVPVKGTGNKASDWIFKVLNHPKFRACIAALEVINTAVKVNKLNSQTTAKNIINTSGAVASLVSASTNYAEAKIAVKGIRLSSKSSNLLTGTTKIAGFIGSGINVTMCVWDSIETYQSRDYDASVTWAITGALSAVLLADSIVAFSTGAAFGFLSFWPLAILFVLVLIGTALAIYFTDTPLEKFLKNNVLGSEHTLPAGSEAPYQYIKKVYNDRNRLVESDFAIWRDFKKASQDLYDLLISYRVREEVTSFYYKPKELNSIGDYIKDALRLSIGTEYQKVQEVIIRVYLRKFFYNRSSFDFAMRLFVEGFDNPNNSCNIYDYKTAVNTDENGADVLEITYQIPERVIAKMSSSAEFIFISRTIINEKLNEY